MNREDKGMSEGLRNEGYVKVKRDMVELGEKNNKE